MIQREMAAATSVSDWIDLEDDGTNDWEVLENDESSQLSELQAAHAVALQALAEAEAEVETERERRVAAEESLRATRRTVVRQRLVIARQEQEMRNLLGPGAGAAGGSAVLSAEAIQMSRRDRRAAARALAKKSKHNVTSGKRGKVAFAATRAKLLDRRQKGSFASKGSSVSRAGGFKKR